MSIAIERDDVKGFARTNATPAALVDVAPAVGVNRKTSPRAGKTRTTLARQNTKDDRTIVSEFAAAK